MNTNALKKFAQAARKRLMEQVAAKLELVLTTDSAAMREQAAKLQKLREVIDQTSKEQVIDKVAYTWFNRLMALRFMDANDYQPLGIKVITPVANETQPELLVAAKAGSIPDDLKVNRQQINDLLDGKIPSKDAETEVYKLLLIGACNHLSTIFPFLFERIDDYADLLLPDDLLSSFSIVEEMREGMTEEDCSEVELIGWLYQFYISERKDEVFASKSKVPKEDIPAATQLFTPRWIVEYMVQNTLGKLWLQNKPNSKLREHMPYFIESPSSEEVKEGEYLKVQSVEEITLLDQACGSGHILVYAFELFSKIYEEEGYNASEIPKLIIEKNLYGFEIDTRAAQLAGLALMMKARSYYRRLFRKDVPRPQILQFEDVKFSEGELENYAQHIKLDMFSQDLLTDIKQFEQATNYGSLMQIKTQDLPFVKAELPNPDIFLLATHNKVLSAFRQMKFLAKKYHCVVDNPPYMGGGNMNKPLSDFVKKNYKKSKTDLMACFMEAGLNVLYAKGFLGMINQHSWMFLSSYEKLREQLVKDVFFDTLLHLGPRTFPEIGGEVVQNAAFAFWKKKLNKKGTYLRLIDFKDAELKIEKTLEAIKNPDCEWFFKCEQSDFRKIPGNLLGYWLSDNFISAFSNKKIGLLGKSRRGLQPGNTPKIVRKWHEVLERKTALAINSKSNAQESNRKWFKFDTGGGFRKWFGNLDSVVNWENNGFDIKNGHNPIVPSQELYFTGGIVWSMVSSGKPSFRLHEPGIIAGNASPCFYSNKSKTQLIGLLNSTVTEVFLSVIAPTLNFLTSDVDKIPVSFSNFNESLIINCINFAKEEWNSRETSWDFQKNELLQHRGEGIEESYDSYCQYWKNKFFQLHNNEEELNRQFIEIYGLQEELTPDVPLEDITILKSESSIENGELVFNRKEVMMQFVSYAVGCMFGRYSLEQEGLVLANQGETLEDFLAKLPPNSPAGAQSRFLPDDDNIIPVLDDEWFEDDITGRFYEFLKVTFGENDFKKNLAFVEEALGKDIRKYLVKDFYNDHIKRYKKRPIYWMFSSPKGAFNVLIYLHRYTPDTLNTILNDYLVEYREKLKTKVETLQTIADTGSATEKVKAEKEQERLRHVLLELQEYERSTLYPLATERIAIDLDDGVLVNYNKFGSAIKLVKGLNDAKTKKKVRGFDWIEVEEIRD